MNRVRLLFVFLLVVIIDQITKTLILNYMSNNIQINSNNRINKNKNNEKTILNIKNV